MIQEADILHRYPINRSKDDWYVDKKASFYDFNHLLNVMIDEIKKISFHDVQDNPDQINVDLYNTKKQKDTNKSCR